MKKLWIVTSGPEFMGSFESLEAARGAAASEASREGNTRTYVVSEAVDAFARPLAQQVPIATVPHQTPIDFERRVKVEQYLLDAAKGKHPLPDAAKCVELASTLGVPAEYRASANLAPDGSEISSEYKVLFLRYEEIKHQLHDEEERHALLQSRCYEGFPSGTDGIFDALKAADAKDTTTTCSQEEADAARLDWMATHLHRIGEIHLPEGKKDCHAWAISSARNDLREALDAAIAASASEDRQ